MNLIKYYKKAAIYPSLFVLLFGTINSIIANFEKNGHSDYSTIIISIITVFLYSLLMSGLSLTIFLNKIKKLNSNLIWNILTWFLLPFSYLIIAFVHDLKIRNKYEFGFGNDFLYLIILTIPFVIGLCWSFIKFRRKLRRANVIRILK
jgi:hypothetical protein